MKKHSFNKYIERYFMKTFNISTVKLVSVLLFLAVVIISPILNAQGPPEPTGRRLRVIMDDKYPGNSIIIGGTTGSWAFGTNTGIIMDREFNYVTPENDFKQWNIHPDNSSNWNWAQPDAWIDHISANGQMLRMHGPIGPQCSQWAQDDSRTPVELETNMTDFMTAVCQRYNGTPGYEYMDVVNETVLNGTWHTDKPGFGWECPWYKMGVDNDINSTPLYIKKSFEIAKQNAPDVKFIYNQHENPEVTSSWDLIKETIFYLRNKGLRVDGIGWQAHIENGWATPDNLNALRNLIDWAHNNNLEFHITEASVWLFNGISPLYLEQQAETYKAIVEVLLEKRSSGKVGWNTWHIDDGHGWHTEWYPALFDTVYTAKPAYYAIQEALENAPVGFIENKKNNPHTFQLFNNYPNPFNPSTIIEYSLPQYGFVTLKIYDILGRAIATLVNEEIPAGTYEVNFSASELTSGVYFYKLQAGSLVQTKKMILLK